MREIIDKVQALRQRQFGNMHDFHVTRYERVLTSLCEEFGEEALTALASVEVDRFTLYKWHLEHISKSLDSLTEQFGPEAIGIVQSAEAATQLEEGRQLALAAGSSFGELVKLFSGGRTENVIYQSETEAVIRTRGCMAGRAAIELGRTDLIYRLHCALDPLLAEGFNPDFGCEVRCTIMDGGHYCEHRLFVRSKQS